MAGERIVIWRRRFMEDADWEKILDLPLNSGDEDYKVYYYDGDPAYPDDGPDRVWRL